MLIISDATRTGAIINTLALQIANNEGPNDSWRSSVTQSLQPRWRATTDHQNDLAVLEINDPMHPSTRITAAIIRRKDGYYHTDTCKTSFYQATVLFQTYTCPDPYRLIVTTFIKIKQWLTERRILRQKHILISARDAKYAMGDAANQLLITVHAAAKQRREQAAARAFKQTSKKARKETKRRSTDLQARLNVNNDMPQINQLLEKAQDTSSWKNADFRG